MFLRTRLLLLDPEEVRRRKRLRARIIRRNRIKKEIEQGLEPSLHRKGYEPSNTRVTDDASDFAPTFGGDSDQRGHAQDRYVTGTLRTSYKAVDHNPPSSRQATLGRKPHTQLGPSVAGGIYTHDVSSAPVPSQANGKTETSVASSTHQVRSLFASHAGSVSMPALSLAIATKARMRWQDAYRRAAFQRHEEILAKDPKRKWRQERFGYLLFERQEFERAVKHLTLAITLGATSSTCWRRLAQSHFHAWQAKGDWNTLWDAKGAYEQALNHVEIACNPFALFEYARVLEMLGVYTGALSVCASILQTFPRFQQIEQVKIRFVLLQRYQIFSPAGAVVTAMEAIEKEAVLLKCIEYTKSLLLSKPIAEVMRSLVCAW